MVVNIVIEYKIYLGLHCYILLVSSTHPSMSSMYVTSPWVLSVSFPRPWVNERMTGFLTTPCKKSPATSSNWTDPAERSWMLAATSLP